MTVPTPDQTRWVPTRREFRNGKAVYAVLDHKPCRTASEVVEWFIERGLVERVPDPVEGGTRLANWGDPYYAVPTDSPRLVQPCPVGCRPAAGLHRTDCPNVGQRWDPYGRLVL